MTAATVDINNAIAQSLSAYVEANAECAPTDFKVKRELDIARYALEESLSIHGLVTSTVKRALADVQEKLLASSTTPSATTPSATTPPATTPPADNKTLSQQLRELIILADNLEQRHRRLQESAKVVASIAKAGAEIENLLATKLDAAQVYSIIIQLPHLLLSLMQHNVLSFFRRENLTIANSHPLSEHEAQDVIQNLVHEVVNSFAEEIERNVSVLTYAKTIDNPSYKNKDGSLAVVEAHVLDMLKSVPTAPTVVSNDSPEARIIEGEKERR